MRITWLSHSAYRLEFGRSVVLIDPFLTGNPAFRGDAAQATEGATHILLTHGHGDHVGDTLEIARRTGATVAGDFDLLMWLGKQGLERMEPMNSGGSVDLGGFRAALTIAFHSSGQLDETGVSQNLGEAHGVVVEPEGGPAVWHMGDTDIFSDMALIAELYRPAVAMVPIGDRFTMGPRLAAQAVRRFLPGTGTVLPCHFGTFPLLTGTPEAFLAEMGDQAHRVRVPVAGQAFEV